MAGTSSGKFFFDVVQGGANGRTYFLCSETPAERDEWLKVLRESCKIESKKVDVDDDDVVRKRAFSQLAAYTSLPVSKEGELSKQISGVIMRYHTRHCVLRGSYFIYYRNKDVCAHLSALTCAGD